MQNMNRLITALILVFASGRALALEPPPAGLTLFVLAGQSNMSGRGPLEDLPPGFPEHGERLWNFTNAYRWEKAQEPIDSATGQLDEVSSDPRAKVGPGLAFADRMAALFPDMNVGLIPCARQGSKIEEWQRAEGRDTLYGSCMARIREASQYGEVAGMIWWHGETDSHRRDLARRWADGFRRVIDDFRRDLGKPDMPMVFAQIGTVSWARRRRTNGYRMWSYIKRAQEKLDIPNTVMIKSEQYELLEDGMHLKTVDYLKIGADFANALQPMLGRR